VKLPDNRDLINSLVYIVWFLIVCFLFRGNDNINYAYIGAWCSSLWISSILNIKLKSVMPSFSLLLITYLIDGFGKFFILTSPKQTEDLTLIVFTAIGILPIIINYYTQKIIVRNIDIA
jgi:hypothetical protein